MTLYFVVLLMVGAVTAIFFGMETSLRTGERLTEYWIIAGLVLTILSPFLGIFRLIKSIVQRVRRLSHRNRGVG